MPVRILVVDDSPFWRERFSALLEEGCDCIVFEACDGMDAVDKSRWIHPDIVILDFCMPVLDGVNAARMLKRLMPDCPLFIVTVDKNPFLEMAALEAGVAAVFSKMECLNLCNFINRTTESRAA
jgi:CheY-like chemotaxis protein